MTIFSDIQFNPAFHTYTYQGKRLNNITGLVNRLNSFDRDSMAARIAKREGREIEAILAEWEAKGKESRERGSIVHEHIENVLSGFAQKDDPFLSLNPALPETEAFDYLWQSLREIVEVVKIEWIVGDIELGISGTLDSLFLQDEILHIFDWKTGKEFATKSQYNKQCLPPFDDLDDCELVKYSLQTSLYRLCLDRNGKQNGLKHPIGDSYIVYLSRSGLYHIHKAIDLRGRLLEWLQDA